MLAIRLENGRGEVYLKVLGDWIRSERCTVLWYFSG